jgi:hypothetical protein
MLYRARMNLRQCLETRWFAARAASTEEETSVLNCRRFLIWCSEAQDRRLGLLERWRLRVHLKVCEAAATFTDHMQFMRRRSATIPSCAIEEVKDQ